jgi:2-amino-4-hydroxy-6-hydroxymethyldihydropteridine diphosphokinase
VRSIVALGSNLGDRAGNLRAGLAALAALGPLFPSPMLMETPDESGIGPDYLNTVALLDSSHTNPVALLEELLRIEARLGRDRRAGRNAPRSLDLDLIAVEGQQGTWPGSTEPGPHLQLPHPRAKGRAFVLEPLRALLLAKPEFAAPWLFLN